MSARTLAEESRTQPFAGGINGRCGTGGASTHDEDVERCFGRELGSLFLDKTLIKLGNNFSELMTACHELLAVQKNCRHGHDAAFFHLILKECTVDRRYSYVGIEHGHEVESLYYIRAVMA